MNPIERAARAMYETVQPDWDWDDPDAELLRQMYRANARAAIAALHDPSEAMLMAAARLDPGMSPDAAIRGALYWKAMLGAALEQD